MTPEEKRKMDELWQDLLIRVIQLAVLIPMGAFILYSLILTLTK